MSNSRYFISDFVEIQRKSFFDLLEKGIIDEFSKRNPITSLKKDVELYFYPEYYN
jgi:DNA-directed RNA polymerase subunit beta